MSAYEYHGQLFCAKSCFNNSYHSSCNIQDFYHCLHAKFESTANCVVDHEVEIIQQPVPEEKDIDSTATRYSIVNSNNTHIWSSTVERSNCFENDNTKKSPGPCDVKLEFLRPDFDLDADRFDAEMKHPYFSQMNFKESQGCSSNFAMPEIQMPVQKQDNFNGNYFALGNESWWLKFAYKIIHKAKF